MPIQNKAINRSTEEKRRLVWELRETLSGTTVRGLRETLPPRIRALQAEIREEEAAAAMAPPRPMR